MNYLRINWIALTLFSTTVFCEYFLMLFAEVPFNEVVNFNAPVGYLTNAIGASTLITSLFIFILTKKEKIASRLILFGLIIWNLIEVYENICYMAKINNSVLFISGSAWFQMSFIIAVLLGSIYGFSKSKY